MDELIRRRLEGDFGHRTRTMEALGERVKRDYAVFKRLWEKMKKAPLERGEEEELIRAMSWVRLGVRTFKRLRGMSIEGVTWVEIDEIERDMKAKQELISKVLILSE